MAEIIPGFLHFDTIQAANSIFLLGLIMVLGALGGLFLKRLKIPQVVGYIIIGILVGQSGSQLIGSPVLSSLEPISSFALSLIGFLIGSELKLKTLKKYGKQFTGILFFEAIIPFITVGILTAGVFYLTTGNIPLAVSLGLLLGAISSATAPAATTDVLAENRTRGPVTTMVLGIVAMDDAIALILFAIASTIASGLLGSEPVSLGHQLLTVVYTLGVSALLGTATGFILSRVLKSKETDEGRTLAFSLGMIMLVTGVCSYLGLDSILAAMAMGFFIVNFTKGRTSDLFALVDRFTPPIYILFFVLVGAKLNVRNVSTMLGMVAVVYIVGRTAGKFIGATFGARITGAPTTVRKYLKWCLLSQAGVAIGLSMMAGHIFRETVGPTIVLVVTATTFVVQLIGPIFVKHGVTRAGECGLDITEDDLLKESTVANVLDEQRVVPHVVESAPFEQIVSVFGRQSSLSCLVSTADKQLAGIITIENLKEALLLGELTNGLLACDIMEPVSVHCVRSDSIRDVRDMFGHYDIDSIPVLEKDGTIAGLIEERAITKYFHKKVLELHNKACALELT